MPTALETQQRDILATSLANNPFFQPNPVPTLDNSLKTTSKKIVGAINELQKGVGTNNQSVESMGIALREEINQTNTALTTTNQEVEVLDQRVTSVETEVTEVKNDVAALSVQLTKNTEAVNQNTQAVAENNQSIITLADTLNDHIANDTGAGGTGTGGAAMPQLKRIMRAEVNGSGNGNGVVYHIITHWPKDIIYKLENFRVYEPMSFPPKQAFKNAGNNLVATIYGQFTDLVNSSAGQIEYTNVSSKLGFKTIAGDTRDFLYLDTKDLEYTGQIYPTSTIGVASTYDITGMANTYIIASLDGGASWVGYDKATYKIVPVELTRDSIMAKGITTTQGFVYLTDQVAKNMKENGKTVRLGLFFAPTASAVATIPMLKYGLEVTHAPVQVVPTPETISSTGYIRRYTIGRMQNGDLLFVAGGIYNGRLLLEYLDYGDTNCKEDWLINKDWNKWNTTL